MREGRKKGKSGMRGGMREADKKERAKERKRQMGNGRARKNKIDQKIQMVNKEKPGESK